MRRPVLILVVFLAALGPLTLAAPSGAHTRSLSYSSWQIEGDTARVRVRIPRLELTRVGLDAPPGNTRLRALAGQYLAGKLELHAEAGRCIRESAVEPRRAREGWAAFAWTLRCAGGAPDRIRSHILLEAAPGHLHFARVAGQGERIRERVLTDDNRDFALVGASDAGGGSSAAGESRLETLGRYLTIGVEHILSGWDHLAFVVALLLLARTFGEVARLVSGFTIAHSLTLALAVLGWVDPRPAAVEAVIGFSVALVAAENAWAISGRRRSVPLTCGLSASAVALLALLGIGELSALTAIGLALLTWCHFGLLERSSSQASIRAALAFAFGLVHGFGFAGILGEMQLPAERLVPALFGFNAGVELGQLAVVAIVWPLLRALARTGEGRIHRWTIDASSAAICGVGLFWFITRSFGGA